MIYLDSSVLLAHLLAENRQPPQAIWDEILVSSRLLEYEVWCQVHVRGLSQTHAEDVNVFVGLVDLIDLSSQVLDRALDPFPLPVRTLDALHLATIEYIRGRGQAVKLASFDNRMNAAARALDMDLYQL